MSTRKTTVMIQIRAALSPYRRKKIYEYESVPQYVFKLRRHREETHKAKITFAVFTALEAHRQPQTITSSKPHAAAAQSPPDDNIVLAGNYQFSWPGSQRWYGFSGSPLTRSWRYDFVVLAK